MKKKKGKTNRSLLKKVFLPDSIFAGLLRVTGCSVTYVNGKLPHPLTSLSKAESSIAAPGNNVFPLLVCDASTMASSDLH